MIKGYCIGGGLGLALCCDLRIASDNSKFGVPAAKLGLGYAYPGLKRLVDVVGPAFAKEIFFTGRQFDADEARVMGLINRVVPADELESYVKNYADTIAGNAPLTLKAVKFIVGETVQGREQARPRPRRRTGRELLHEPGLHRRPPAFMEKRKPVVHGEVTTAPCSLAKSSRFVAGDRGRD